MKRSQAERKKEACGPNVNKEESILISVKTYSEETLGQNFFFCFWSTSSVQCRKKTKMMRGGDDIVGEAQISSMECAGTRPRFLPLLNFTKASPSSHLPTQI